MCRFYNPNSGFYVSNSMKTLLSRARQYATDCHTETNHLYDGKPYTTHLLMVQDIAIGFLHLIPKEDWEVVLAGCWVHDVIEDTRQTYNDVKNATSESVADLAYALTNEKGKNRKERANARYYTELRAQPYAVFIKLCDRIANTLYSKSQGGRMYDMYKKEETVFSLNLDPDGSSPYKEMFDYLHNL